jgi:hypothetical protein
MRCQLLGCPGNHPRPKALLVTQNPRGAAVARGLKPTVSGGGVRPRGICIRRGQAVPNELGGTQSCLRKPPGRLVPNQSKGSRSNSGKRAMVAATEADSSRSTCAERTPTVPAGSPIPARKHARRWQTSPRSGSIADGPQKSVSVSLRGRRFGAAFDKGRSSPHHRLPLPSAAQPSSIICRGSVYMPASLPNEQERNSRPLNCVSSDAGWPSAAARWNCPKTPSPCPQGLGFFSANHYLGRETPASLEQ